MEVHRSQGWRVSFLVDLIHSKVQKQLERERALSVLFQDELATLLRRACDTRALPQAWAQSVRSESAWLGRLPERRACRSVELSESGSLATLDLQVCQLSQAGAAAAYAIPLVGNHFINQA